MVSDQNLLLRYARCELARPTQSTFPKNLAIPAIIGNLFLIYLLPGFNYVLSYMACWYL